MSKNKAVSVILLTMIMLLSACQGSTQEQSLISDELLLPEQTNYSVTQVQKSTYKNTAQGPANLIYPVYADLSLETEGARFKEKFVQLGDQVKKGDVLATFDIEVNSIELQDMQLRLKRAKDELDEGCQERMTEIRKAERRTEYLVSDEQKIAKLELEKLQIDYEQFVYQKEIEIARIQEDIAEMQEATLNNTLVAPFDGVIRSVGLYNEGDRIEADDIILSMYSSDQFLLRVSDSFDKLRYNMEVTVTAGRSNNKQEYTGKVIAAPNILSSSIPMNYALIELEGEVSQELLAMAAQFTCFTEEIDDVLMVDRSAVRNENGDSYVYLLEDDIAKKRYVVAGERNKSGVWILDGLTEGQTLILD